MTVHDHSGGGESWFAANMMMVMMFFVLAILVIGALVYFQPWAGSDEGEGGGGGIDVDINGGSSGEGTGGDGGESGGSGDSNYLPVTGFTAVATGVSLTATVADIPFDAVSITLTLPLFRFAT